ncbi:MAG: MORN repeat-containing protein [Reyranella sp.]
MNVPLASIALLLMLLPVFAQAQAPQPKAGWFADPKTGCKTWDETPSPGQTMNWTGGCANGLAEGNGTVRWSAGGTEQARYVGQYRAGRMNGRGVFSRPNGDRYEGEFINDNFSGRGAYTWANGNRFEGQWKEGKPNGQGTKTTAKGQVFTGNWTNGCFREGKRWATAVATAKACGFE